MRPENRRKHIHSEINHMISISPQYMIFILCDMIVETLRAQFEIITWGVIISPEAQLKTFGTQNCAFAKVWEGTDHHGPIEHLGQSYQRYNK